MPSILKRSKRTASAAFLLCLIAGTIWIVWGRGTNRLYTAEGLIFGKPAIVTDTHCIRLVNRMGLVDGIKEPAKVEKELWKIIPPEEGSDFCHRLVYHGRAVCTARTKPYCEKCCLEDICGKCGV